MFCLRLKNTFYHVLRLADIYNIQLARQTIVGSESMLCLANVNLKMNPGRLDSMQVHIHELICIHAYTYIHAYIYAYILTCILYPFSLDRITSQ